MKSDSEIQQDILRELRWDNRVKETEIGVEVDKGVVTLSGTVSSYGKKVAACQVAHQVAGVLDVANDINVVPPGSSTITDTDIAAAVRHELQWNVFVRDEKIRSTVAQGWVTLEGTVDLFSQRDEVEEAIRNLQGVHGVINDIRVDGHPVDPSAVRSAIHEALDRRAVREADRITVVVDDQTVTLSGRVHSWREKAAVVGAAGHAPGIRKVVDHLRIEPHF